MAPEKGWRRDLYIIIFESDTKYGRLFDLLLLWAIILSVLCVILESDPSVREVYSSQLRYAELVFTILFSIEYILRIICINKPLKYVKSFYGIVDFVSIAPTYLSIFIQGSQFLLVIRAIRLLRIFRILKLARYLTASETLFKALKESRAKITVFLGVVLTIVLIMGTIMHLVEGDSPGFSSIPRGMYWAIVTMTTVGYGDVVPVTTFGKLLASVIMIMGYGIIAVPTGIVSVEIANASREVEFAKCDHCDVNLLAANSRYCHVCGESVNQLN